MLFQVVIGFLLIAVWTVRPVLYRSAVQYFAPSLSSAFTSIWLIISLVLTFPFLGHLFTDDWQKIIFSPFILLCIYKGISLFYFVKYQQIVNKTSTSSSVFMGFIALPLGMLINNLFFGEGLGIIKICAIMGLGILGTIFFVKGDASRLSEKGKHAFAIATVNMASYMVVDHLVIPQIGWYSHVLFTSVTMFVISLIHGVSKQNLKNIIKNRYLVSAGIIYAFSEFLVIFASINIMPVSIVTVFTRMSIPVVMIYSAIRYKEQSIKNQLVFALTAIILALPIILLKQ